ncbi:MAG: beta strand repeat-containing protein [Acidimicrobiales bacterium]
MSALRNVPRAAAKAMMGAIVIFAVAMPIAAVATPAGAATGPTITTVYNFNSTFSGTAVPFSQAEVWQGGGTYDLWIQGTGFAANLAGATFTTTAPGVTVDDFTEVSSTLAEVEIDTSAATTQGFYPVTITDSNGTATYANGLGVNASTNIASATLSNFPANANVWTVLTGTLLAAPGEHIHLFDGAGNDLGALTQVTTSQSSTSVLVNSLTQGLAAGTYYLVPEGLYGTWADGGEFGNMFPISVVAPVITGLQPAAGLVIPATTLVETVIVTGNGFLPGATLGFGGASPGTSTYTSNGVTLTLLGAPTVTPTTITQVITVSGAGTPSQVNVYVQNPGGYTLSAPNALGIGEPGVTPTTGPSLICGACTLSFGVSGMVAPVATAFPVTVGTTANFTSAAGPSFTGTVSAVSGSSVIINATPPRYASATLSAATAAGATTLPLSSTTGLAPGMALTVVDGGSTELLKAGAVSAGSVVVPATLFAHAAGVTVEWSLASTLYTVTINNGTYTEGGPVTVNANTTTTDHQTPNPEVNGDAVAATGNVIKYGGSFTFLATLPGFGFGSSSTGKLVNSVNGGPASGSVSINPLSGDKALVTVTMPSSVTSSASLTASNDGGSGAARLADGVHFVNTDGNSGQAGDTAGMPIGEFKAAFTTASLPAGFGVGSTVTATTAGPSQTFVVSAVESGDTATSTTATTVVTFSTAAGFNIPTNAAWSAGVASATPPLNLDMELFNGTGAAQYFGLSTNSTFGPASYLDLTGSISVGAVTPSSLGQGATAIPVVVSIGGDGVVYDCSDYTVSSSNTSVSFGAVTACTAGSLTTTMTIAPGATLSGNVPITVQGGYGGGATSSTAIFAITAGPTITSVTSLGTLSSGESGAFTIMGTGLTIGAGFSVSIINGAGPYAGSPDTGTANGAPGISVTGCYNPGGLDTEVTCVLNVGVGSQAGPHTVAVTGTTASGSGSTSNASVVVTIAAPTISAITPTNVAFTYGGTWTATLVNYGTLTPTLVSGLSCESSIELTDGSVVGDVQNCNLTYLSASQVTVSMSGFGGHLAPFFAAGDSVIFSIGNAVAWADSPAVLVTSASHEDVFSGPIVAGTTATLQIAGANFMPSSTVISPFTGITVGTVTVLSPELLTVSLTVASNYDGTYELSVGQTGFFSNAALTVIEQPYIEEVNGVDAVSDGGSPYSNLNGTSDTLVITGYNFAQGAVVSTGTPSDGTFGTPVLSECSTYYNLCDEITVPVKWTTFSGATPVVTSLIVTNPPGWGTATSVGEIQINPAPAVTGGPYYVPTFSTSVEVTISGTGFQPGVTISATNSPVYTVSLANSTSTTLTLLVTTTSAATTGTSSTVTVTNPDTGTTSFSLNGGPAPVPPLTVSKTFGRPAHIGKTTHFVLNGTNMAGASVSVSKKGVSVKETGNTATSIGVSVTVKKGTKVGTAKLHITNANGSATVSFSIKK